MPQNFRYIGLLAAAFPEAKIVHVKRNPAAVCWANYKQYFISKNMGFCYALDDIISYYRLYENLGQSFLKAIQLALYDISDKKIKIYPKDSKANPLDTYKSAKEFEQMGIKIVVGPIFYENLERLNEINNVTFISLTNKTKNIPKNTITFGINIESQVNALKEYFDKIKVNKTLLLSPDSEFIFQSEALKKKDILKFYRTYSYNINPKKNNW